MSQVVILGALSLTPAPAHPRLDVFMLTGFLLAFVQVTCFINRRRSRDMAIGLVLTSLALAVFSVLAGAWPLAMVMLAAGESEAIRVTRRMRSHRRRRMRKGNSVLVASPIQTPATHWPAESRLSRMFGPPGSIN